MDYTQDFYCRSWQFGNIPRFTKGIQNPLFADCGSGLTDVPYSQTYEDTFMHTFSDTTADDITGYAAHLEKSGFEKIYEKEICSNLFYQFTADEGLLYVSFMKNTGITRIILDRCKTERICDFGYDRYDAVNNDTVFAQYSLHYDAMIKGTTCDCGMNYVYRLHDNSLIIIDGGEMEQATDIAIADYLDFLHTLTKTDSNEKMRISLWLCTHPHNDHCDFFAKILRFHSDEIILERVAFNFPNPVNTRHSLSVALIRQRIAEKFPSAQYIRLHAGFVFPVANASVEILVDGEDTVGLDDRDHYPGTNASSTLFRITADGISTLFLADCSDDNGNVLIENYDGTKTDCHFLQAAHHGINKIYDVYERINAEKILLPQSKKNMDARFSDIYEHLCQRYKEENILPAHDKTYIFTMKDGNITASFRNHVGAPYDNSEW